MLYAMLESTNRDSKQNLGVRSGSDRKILGHRALAARIDSLDVWVWHRKSWDKTGKRIAHIAVPERWTANVCFGGNDRRTLFITASKGLYAVRIKVKGAR